MAQSTLLSFARIVLYGWAVALWKLRQAICRPRPPRKPGEHRPTQRGCVLVDHPALVRPDPLIYSQRYLMAQGLAVTWDNPDITLFKGGIPVSSAALEPSTTYEVQARIWNNSLDAPVIDMPVHLSYLDFGIGTEPIPIGSTTVDVGVKGSLDQPGSATFLWTTPATPGHYCLQVLLDPVDDVERLNNLGQENTDVVAAHSPAVFTFSLRNDTRAQQQYQFEVDAYTIPTLPRCDAIAGEPDRKLQNHRRERYPVPSGFVVLIVPPRPTLDPGSSISVTVTVEPPPLFVGQLPLNINAFHQHGFAGGVTLTCVKEA